MLLSQQTNGTQNVPLQTVSSGDIPISMNQMLVSNAAIPEDTSCVPQSHQPASKEQNHEKKIALKKEAVSSTTTSSETVAVSSGCIVASALRPVFIVKSESDEIKRIRECSRPISEKIYNELREQEKVAKQNPDQNVKYDPNDPARTNHCQYCPRAFKKRSDLIRHIRIHTNEKPFR